MPVSSGAKQHAIRHVVLPKRHRLANYHDFLPATFRFGNNRQAIWSGSDYENICD
jgi:hypothetical protein